MLLVLIFAVTLLVCGFLPIAVQFTKNKESKAYPFRVSVWMIGCKFVVLVLSYLMLKVWSCRKNAEAGSDVPSENTLDEKLEELVLSEMSYLQHFKLGLWLFPPAALYTMSDLLVFPVLSHINASTYATLNQLKIVVVALLCRFCLRRHVSLLQWVAVVQLVMGALLYKVSW